MPIFKLHPPDVVRIYSFSSKSADIFVMLSQVNYELAKISVSDTSILEASLLYTIISVSLLRLFISKKDTQFLRHFLTNLTFHMQFLPIVKTFHSHLQFLKPK